MAESNASKLANNILTDGKFDATDVVGTLSGFTSTGIDDNATSTAITIDSSNRVGIGDTSPDAMLSIKGNTDDGVTPTIRLKDQTDAREAFISNQSGDLILATSNSGDDTIDSALTIYTSEMIFKTAGTNRITLDSVGNLKVSRAGTAFNVNSTHQLVDSLANSYSLMLSNKSVSPASQYMFEIGFKSASPDNSSAKFIEANDSTTTRFRVNSDGNVYNHDGTYGTISDERIKQDIIDASSQWEDIKNIRVRKYKKKDDVLQYGEENAPTEIGVISQELETVSPGLIEGQKPNSSQAELHEDFAGENPQNVKYVKYSILYMKSIKALQEAMERIETLEAKVTTLENA